MQDTKQGISISRSILGLVLLLLVDAMSFVTVGQGSAGIEFGLVANTSSWVGLGVDLALAFGLVRAAEWALELARYRSVLGLCYLAFIWSSYFIITTRDMLLIDKTVMAGLIRDGWMGIIFLIVLFVLREQKKPVIPVSEKTESEKK